MKIELKKLGLQDYTSVFNQMIDFTANRTDQTADEVWFVEHPAVFTQGKHGKPEHIINLHNIPIVETDRGGQVTYHGQGQAIIYFLLDVKRNKLGAKRLVDTIEQAIERAGTKAGNKGAEAAATAIEMINLMRQV